MKHIDNSLIYPSEFEIASIRNNCGWVTNQPLLKDRNRDDIWRFIYFNTFISPRSRAYRMR